jgi:hypothetical protein
MGPGRAAHGQRTALPAARLGGALVCVGSTMTFVFGATVPSYSNDQPMAVLLPSVVAFVFGLWCIAMGARTHRYVVYAIPSAAALAMSGSLWVTDTALERRPPWRASSCSGCAARSSPRWTTLWSRRGRTR